ncbi:alpha/beta hydrolase family protein [Kitasatospora xanthocidica]|uniref:alpha/beta hydrolase family protein n=1 Tax=Kitasatospora xanthocidica TaxID=83382 RepID=UPI0036EC7956
MRELTHPAAAGFGRSTMPAKGTPRRTTYSRRITPVPRGGYERHRNVCIYGLIRDGAAEPSVDPMKRNRRISAVAALALAALVTGTGTGFAATTTQSATPVATHAFDTEPAAATAPTRSFHGTLPAPTGPYAAGEEIIHLTDTSRLDPWVPSSGPRQLTVTMVYPAVPGTGTPAPYMTLAEAAGIIQHRKLPASSGITPQTLSSVTTHAFDGARPQHGRHPLVVLSAAAENPRMMLTSLATELVSHGYVVALVGHTYEDTGETLANGETPPCAICDPPETIDFNAETTSRARDVSFVIDQLTHGNTAWRLAHLIDKHEIGMAGHSLGGATAAATMIADPRVRAGVDMDGTFFPAPEPGQINRPFLMLGRADGHTPGSGGDDIVWKQAWDALGGYKKWLTVVGADHFDFADGDVLQEQAGFPTAPLSPERGVEITREYVTAFFDQTLKGIHSPLLDGPSPNNPEVLFHS